MNSPTPNDKARMLRTLREALAIVEALPVSRDCRECDHFAQASQQCAHWGEQVPDEAIAAGCEAWEEGIPF